MKQYLVYIQDILSAIEAIEKFVDGVNLNQFLEDDKTSSAVIRKFEIMGEATKQVPIEVRSRYPDIPWREISRMRDKLIHHYAGVNLILLFETIEIELPKLKVQLNAILRQS